MLNVHVRNLGTIAVVCLEGQIVRGEVEMLQKAVQSISDVKAVILDLARVKTVDAGGLGVMLELREQTAARGIRFELMNLTSWVRRVLAVSRLDSVFQITSGVEFFTAARKRVSMAALQSCA